MDFWDGWYMIWRLYVNPHVKVFMWRLFHGRTPTFSFLYKLNIWPQMMCPFCDLLEEIDEHIIWECQVSKKYWDLVSVFTATNLNRVGEFTERSCLSKKWQSKLGSKGLKDLMSSCTWAI